MSAITGNTHGGAGRHQGRRTIEGKPHGSGRARSRTVTLTEAQWEFLIQMGEGNASRGIRRLIERAEEKK